MTVVGIDLGTTNSLIALWRNGQSEIVPNPLGHALTPSVVSIDADGTVLVGEAARERLQSHPERSVAIFALVVWIAAIGRAIVATHGS